MPNLLIELFSEEIPARMQRRAAEDLKKLITNGMVDAGLTYAGATAFSTPRRLTLAVEDVLSESPTVREERKGPRVDAPEKAIEGFLRGAGLSKDQLEVRDEKKGQVYFATIEKPGRPAADIIAEVLEHAIRNFPWPKSMRWGAGTLRWVRPLHSIICVLSDEVDTTVVPVNIDDTSKYSPDRVSFSTRPSNPCSAITVIAALTSAWFRSPHSPTKIQNQTTHRGRAIFAAFAAR